MDVSDTGSKVHKIFINEPLQLMNYVDKYVEIKLKTQEKLKGVVYTIDPVSESVILIEKEPSEETKVIIVLQNSIDGIQISEDIRPDVNTEFLFRKKDLPSKASLVRLKDSLKNWLLKNMIPIIEDGELLKMENLVIHPPYDSEHCYCDNPLVLSRIQTLVRSMNSEDLQNR